MLFRAFVLLSASVWSICPENPPVHEAPTKRLEITQFSLDTDFDSPGVPVKITIQASFQNQMFTPLNELPPPVPVSLSFPVTWELLDVQLDTSIGATNAPAGTTKGSYMIQDLLPAQEFDISWTYMALVGSNVSFAISTEKLFYRGCIPEPTPNASFGSVTDFSIDFDTSSAEVQIEYANYQPMVPMHPTVVFTGSLLNQWMLEKVQLDYGVCAFPECHLTIPAGDTNQLDAQFTTLQPTFTFDVQMLFHTTQPMVAVTGASGSKPPAQLKPPAPLAGKKLGSLSGYLHDVAGKVSYRGESTIVLQGFQYAGDAPDANFYIGQGEATFYQDAFLLYPAGSFPGQTFLGPYPRAVPNNPGEVVLEIPASWGMTLHDFSWLTVWSPSSAVHNFGDIHWTALQQPGTASAAALTTSGMLRQSWKVGNLVPYSNTVQGEVHFDNDRLIVIKNFEYDGDSNARVYVGSTVGDIASAKPLQFVDKGDLSDAPLRKWGPLNGNQGEPLILPIPEAWNAVATDFSWLTIWSLETGNLADLTWSPPAAGENAVAQPGLLKSSFLGALTGYSNGIGGFVHTEGDRNGRMVIKRFMFDGLCKDATFRLGADTAPVSAALVLTPRGMPHSYLPMANGRGKVVLVVPMKAHAPFFVDYNWLFVYCASTQKVLADLVWVPQRPPAVLEAPREAEQAKKSPAPEQAKKSPAPEQAKKSPAPEQAKKSPAPEQAKKSPAPEQAKKSPAPAQEEAEQTKKSPATDPPAEVEVQASSQAKKSPAPAQETQPPQEAELEKKKSPATDPPAEVEVQASTQAKKSPAPEQAKKSPAPEQEETQPPAQEEEAELAKKKSPATDPPAEVEVQASAETKVQAEEEQVVPISPLTELSTSESKNVMAEMPSSSTGTLTTLLYISMVGLMIFACVYFQSHRLDALKAAGGRMMGDSVCMQALLHEPRLRDYEPAPL